jgi:predicted nucleic acid-binding protein
MTTGVSAAAGPLYSVDSSVWQRLPRAQPVREALGRLAERGTLCLSAPVILEIGFSAPSPGAWDKVMDQVAGLAELTLTAGTRATASRMQGLLWRGGLVRAAGVFDTLAAAVALEHGAVVVHYDRDFEHLASVCPEFRHEWVVPAGSVD